MAALLRTPPPPAGDKSTRKQKPTAKRKRLREAKFSQGAAIRWRQRCEHQPVALGIEGQVQPTDGAPINGAQLRHILAGSMLNLLSTRGATPRHCRMPTF